MILPHPESNLRINIMVLGARIIDIMSKKPFEGKYVIVDKIMNEFLKGDSKRTPDLFWYTITFLYTIGSIENKDYKIKLIKKKAEQKQMNLFQ